MKIEFKGTVKAIFPAKTLPNGLVIREFKCAEHFDNDNKNENVLQFATRFNPSYDQYDNTVALEHLKVGDFVKFYFIIRGRDWKGQNGKVMNFADLKPVSAIETYSDSTFTQRTWSSAGTGRVIKDDEPHKELPTAATVGYETPADVADDIPF